MTRLGAVQALLFRFRAGIAFVGVLAALLLLWKSSLAAGFICFISGLLMLWAMKLHPQAEADDGPFFVRAGVRKTMMVVAVIALLGLTYLTIDNYVNHRGCVQNQYGWLCKP